MEELRELISTRIRNEILVEERGSLGKVGKEEEEEERGLGEMNDREERAGK